MALETRVLLRKVSGILYETHWLSLFRALLKKGISRLGALGGVKSKPKELADIQKMDSNACPFTLHDCITYFLQHSRASPINPSA